MYPILRQVVGLSGSAVEEALLRALDDSDFGDQGRLVEALLERGRSRGLAGLVARYHLLNESARARFRRAADGAANILHPCLKSNSRQVRLNAIQIISHNQRTETAYLAVLALSDSDRGIADWACQSLRGQAERFLAAGEELRSHPQPLVFSQGSQAPGPAKTQAVRQAGSAAEPGPDSDPQTVARYAAWQHDRANLVRAMGAVLETFPAHHRTAALEPVAWLADELMDVLVPLITEAGHDARVLLTDLIWQRNDPRLAPLIELLVSLAPTRPKTAAFISGLRDRNMLAELLRRFARPTARQGEFGKGLAAVQKMAFFEQAGWWERIGDELADPTVRWIMALGAGQAKQVEWLMQLIRDGSAAQRSAALDQLCRWPAPEATEVLRQLLDFPEATVAEQAADELARRSGQGGQDPARPRTAWPTAEPMRSLADEQAARHVFDRFWAEFNGLNPSVQQFAAEKLPRIVPDLVERLAARMTDPDPRQRLQAVRVADLCGLALPLAQSLYIHCADPNAKVRSAVVKLIGRIPAERSEQLVSAALADPDRRVRANAVEALESLRPRAGNEQLVRMIDNADNRVRANAIKALMACDLLTARRSLHAMLSDGSPSHRLSALWVVQQVQWFKTAELVLRLAQQDPDARVRRRALQTLGHLRRMYRSLGPTTPARHADTPFNRDPKEGASVT